MAPARGNYGICRDRRCAAPLFVASCGRLERHCLCLCLSVSLSLSVVHFLHNIRNAAFFCESRCSVSGVERVAESTLWVEMRSVQFLICLRGEIVCVFESLT